MSDNQITFEVLEAALSGRGAAQEAAAKELRATMTRLVGRGVDAALVEDGVQTAFVKLFKAWKQRGPSMFESREPSSVTGYVATIVRNTLRDAWRQARREAPPATGGESVFGEDARAYEQLSSSAWAVERARGFDVDGERGGSRALRSVLEALHERVVERAPALRPVLDQVWRMTVEEPDLDNEDLVDRSEWEGPDLSSDERARRRKTALYRLQKQHSRWRQSMLQAIERARARREGDEASWSIAQRFIELCRQRSGPQ
jgi:DNA-directed RNA polymerase specialized sigma24 family protein